MSYTVTTGFLPPLEPQALLPAGYPAIESNCLNDPVPDAIVTLFTLFALFAEPKVDKALCKRPEKSTRSQSNCRHDYSLLSGMAAITQPLSGLTQLS